MRLDDQIANLYQVENLTPEEIGERLMADPNRADYDIHDWHEMMMHVWDVIDLCNMAAKDADSERD